MKHNVMLTDGKIQTLDCKLGSGIYDRTGKEIFEGDRVKIYSDSSVVRDGHIFFKEGKFICFFEDENDLDTLSLWYADEDFEVVEGTT